MKKLLAFALACVLAAPGLWAHRSSQPSWLSDAVFYQIYPSSFQDSDGDGYGDLQGIISRLDYIRSIGVTAIWLNPVYVSGWTDGGYDIIDFYKVDPRFGNNEDLIRLLKEAHARGIKVVMDLVAGHSSDQCEWFLQSREGADLRYSDYYIWPSFKPEEKSADPAASADPDYAALMSAHLSLTRKFVATDAPRGPYYIKNFYDTQPALNFGFANPDPSHPWEQAVDAPGPMSMRRELKNIMSFWMDKGVDGFRVDMAASLVKNDPDKAETIRLWNEDFVPWFDKEYPEGILIAEWFNPAQSVAQAGLDLDFFCHDGQYNYSSLFFFNRGFGPAGSAKPYFAKAGDGELKTWYDLYTYQYDAVKGNGYVCMPSGNHDFNRYCTEGRTDPEELKVAMTFFLTMPGVPFIYYGDEIGLKQNPNAPSTDGSGFRAGCRIPMLWDSSANGGFSTAPIDKIYIPQDPDPGRMTVEKEEADPNSLLHYVRGLLQLRKEVPALGADASWKLISSLDQPYPMVYEREWHGERCWVVLNPSGKQVNVTLPAESAKPELIGGNYKKCTYKQGKKGDVITLSATSAAIFKFPVQRGRPFFQANIVSKADRSTVEFVVRDGKPILMDIYQGKGQTEGKRPVFIYSFGGAWAMGSRVDALCNPLYDHLCDKGWVCVSIDYRLGSARGRDGKPLITPPEGYNPFQYSIDIGVEDIYAATSWLIEHADEYNIDPEKMVISGSSAGAINSMNAEYYICSGHRIARENLPADFNYAGVVPMAGAVYLTGEADAELQWDRKPCPMCFFHGSADPTVTFDTERGPARQGFGPRYISRQLDALDVPYMLNEYVDGDHCMALLPIKWFWNEIDSFLDRIVLGGQDLKVHAVEHSSKPRTDANWLDTVRPGQYEAVNRMRRQQP